MLERIMGVLKLDAATFEEIEHDQSATVMAAIIVALVGLLNGVGRKLSANAAVGALDGLEGIEGFENLPFDPVAFTDIGWAGALVGGVISALIGWAIWAFMTNFIGGFMGAKSDMGEMLRVTGFANIPQFIGILPIPCLAGLVASIWSLAAGFVGVRQGLDLDNGKTVIVILLSFIPAVIATGLVNSVIGAIF